MKLLRFLNLRGISGQIAALVVASIVTIHLIITTAFYFHRPGQPDGQEGQPASIGQGGCGLGREAQGEQHGQRS